MAKRRDAYLHEIAELAEAAKAEAMGPTGEVMEHLFRALEALPPATLKDGTEVRFRAFSAPRVGRDGEWSCAVDVRFGDGAYLEFTITNTGWGRPVNHRLTNPLHVKPQHGR